MDVVKQAQVSRVHLRSDDVFFFSMAVVAALTVLVGFARTYFLAGMMRAPLPCTFTPSFS